MALNLKKAKHKEWIEKVNWGNCLLDRQAYGEFLINFLVGEKQGYVLNLDGAWGTGKTELIKRLYGDVLNKNHPAIYINAWESDFTDSPLLVVASELLSQLQDLNENIGDVDGIFSDIKQKFGVVVRASMLGVASYASNKAFGESAILAEPLKELMGMTGDALLNKAREGYAEQVQAIADIREELGNLAEAISTNYQAKLPVFVFVDELDRCRPSYAIELLEVIKHFFDVRNLVFVIASDTSQLSTSIKVVYGAEFDSTRYLKRFFHSRAILKEPNNVFYSVANTKDWKKELGSEVQTYPRDDKLSVEQLIGNLATAFRLSLRDINQIYMKFLSAVRNIVVSCGNEGRKYLFSPYVLAIAIVEHEVSLESFNSRRDFNKIIFGKEAEIVSIVDTCKISNFINLVLSSVSCQEIEKIDDRFQRKYKEIEFVGEQYRIDPNDAGYSNFYDNVFRQLNGINYAVGFNHDGAHHEGNKFLMWSDYKKLVELSGMLS